ncbi:hypothetical protein T03_17679 [Trichinella britovi]|uniref:Uncharacterized protein n=1 Tax=Trichinella britovi TaxID=45882 RepID=A0A0V1ANL0_TRIBR|nr:hypothetical protein T03_17679 [Trichinella britovi]
MLYFDLSNNTIQLEHWISKKVNEVFRRLLSRWFGTGHGAFDFITGFWFCRRDRSGWSLGGIGAFPAKAGSGGPGHGWHCSSPRCEGVPTGDVNRRSRHFPPDALALMELRFF